MNGLITYLFLTVITVTTPLQTDIEESIRRYYDGILSGKVVSYSLDIRRLTTPRSPDAEIIGVRGEDGRQIPRGTRMCWVILEFNGKRHEIPVTLTIKTVERVPVAVTNIRPRTVLTEDLIEWRELPTENFGAAQFLTDGNPEEYWAKVRIPFGTPLTMNRITRRPEVTLGQPVELVFRSGSVEARAGGKALEDGRQGEKIRVFNTISGSRLSGTINESGEVIIE